MHFVNALRYFVPQFAVIAFSLPQEGAYLPPKRNIYLPLWGRWQPEGLTDEVSQSFSYQQINLFADACQILPYCIIGNAQNCDSNRIKVSRPGLVLFKITRIVVLRSVKFNSSFCLSAVEIQNVRSTGNLSAKLNRVCTQILIPQLLFFFGHFPAKLLRK